MLKLQTIFDSPDWPTQLEAYSSREQFKSELTECIQPFGDAVQEKLKKQNIILSGPTLDSRTQLVVKIFQILRNVQCEEILLEILPWRAIQVLLPPIFRKRSENDTMDSFLSALEKAHQVLKNHWKEILSTVSQKGYVKISKKISNLPWSLVVAGDEITQRIMVKGGILDTGTNKKVQSLISLSDTICLAQAQILDFKLLSPVEQKAAYKELEDESDVSDTLLKNNVPYILTIRNVTYKKPTNIMELCEQGNLNVALKKITIVRDRLKLGLQIAQALSGMHKLGYCHLDLKSKNIGVTNNEIRLYDFGAFSAVSEKTELVSTFPAPEMVVSYLKGKRSFIDPGLDLWVLGDLLYLLKFSSSILLQHGLHHETAEKDKKEKQHQFHSGCVTLTKKMKDTYGDTKNPVERCIMRLFSLNPEERPPAYEVAEILDTYLHPKA